MTVEELFSEAVDLLAADPRGIVDERSWRQILIYAPKHLVIERAVATSPEAPRN